MVDGATASFDSAPQGIDKRVFDAVEREQRRIGRDLHDTLGQQLTGVALLAKVLAAQLAHRCLPEAEQAREIAQVLNEAVEQLRMLSKGLCPVELTTDELAKALRELTASVERFSGIRCRFTCGGSIPVGDPQTAVHLYCISREAVNNAVKHACPQEIDVRLAREDGCLTLSVSDDGLGFSPDAKAGMGMSTMKYRARVAGGTLTVGPRPSGGTRVVCTLPVA